MAVTAEPPAVTLSFANNFWGKNDAGVHHLLERMHNAKLTCDELKSFYSARASLEEDYARKLLALCRKPLGSREAGTLRASLDVVRGEVEAMGRSHQNIAAQMRTELEEPLAAFAGAMKERRKIVQNGTEKLLKIKTQQTNTVNKTRDRYEQECLKIKGYLAQGHMVMGQEERKNKAKLEKTQINLATSNTEYETAIKILEETTGRWNRDWKAAADKFQDLEEERLDFTKSSLWTFANIASTVCVSDDASCEKVRLSLENCEVEKDIMSFIKEKGTGQEIPDPPKYINFCRGDLTDSQSETSEDDNYSVAQFQRTINPAYRTSSPQPSTYESHHDPQSALAREMGHFEPSPSQSREATVTPQKIQLTDQPRQQPEQIQANVPYEQPPAQGRFSYEQPAQPLAVQYDMPQQAQPRLPYEQPVQAPPVQYDAQMVQPRPLYEQPVQAPPKQPMNPQHVHNQLAYEQLHQAQQRLQYEHSQQVPLAAVPHDPYPMDGMTMLCRTGPPSDLSSNLTNGRPSSRDSHSDYSNPTSFSSQEPPSGKTSPLKQPAAAPTAEKQVLKKKSGFFQNHSPFRRKSKHEKENAVTPSGRHTWSAVKTSGETPRRAPLFTSQEAQKPNMLTDRASASSPEPIDPRANFQLNVGNNVFDVSTPDRKAKSTDKESKEELDPIAQALEELKGVTKQSTLRTSADSHYGIATPAPGSVAVPRPVGPGMTNNALVAGKRGTPPPSYDTAPVQRLGAPEPAFTSKAMQQTRQKYVDKTQNMLSMGSRTESKGAYASSSVPRPESKGTHAQKSIPRPESRGAQATNSAPRPESRAYGSNSVPRPESRGAYAPSSMSRPESKGAYASGSMSRPESKGAYATSSMSRPGTRGNDVPRARSPVPQRSVSPQPMSQRYNSASPTPYGSQHSPQASSVRGSPQTYYRPTPQEVVRAASPAASIYDRPKSRMASDMAVQLAPAPDDNYAGSVHGQGRPMSYYGGQQGNHMAISRQRSKSVADVRQYSRDGRPILHYSRAMYMYQAAIPEELSFAKGDVLAIIRHQDDGWWEAEVAGKNGPAGLVPSNYLQNC